VGRYWIWEFTLLHSLPKFLVFLNASSALVSQIPKEGTIRFDGPFHLPGSFAVVSADGSKTLRYEESFGGHFEGLYCEAAEVARRIISGEVEAAHRSLDDSLETMATLDMIHRSIGIDFSTAGLIE
jgi:hypothetical protein